MDASVAPDLVLGGRYRLGPLLGSGGMAQVYDGFDERLDRVVAVKLLRPDLAAQAGLRQRFELEARAAARLTHPNVVAVFDAGDDDGRSYIVMERLRGESLADAIAHGPLDVTWLLRLAEETLSAIGAAHDAGIIHRDIKPSNILLGADGRAKVADFGIARVAEAQAASEPTAAMTGTGLVLGTPAYLAPERAMGEPASRQSDLYSLGVVLYEALTGKKPYAGATPVAIAAAALQGAPENPYLLRPDADPQLVAVIARAMARDPADRYATAAQMAADLRRAAAPTPTSIMAIPPLAFGAGAAASPTSPVAAGAGGAEMFETTVPAGPYPGPPNPGPLYPGYPYPRRPYPRRGGNLRWIVAAVAVAAIVALSIAALNARTHSGRPAAASTATSTTVAAPAATVAPSPRTVATTRPPATVAPATTAPSVAVPNDGLGAALAAFARHLAHSKSAAGSQLATGLTQVAAVTDPSARASAATALENQAIQWYQGGQLTSAEYAAAVALLQQVGAPPAPPPTVQQNGNPGGGGGGGG